LYTGDGYLDNKTRLTNLKDHLGEENFKKIASLQVMHHGAKSCWYKGLAKEINPFMSIFSADSIRITPGHPHAEVLRDFITYSPILVDKKNSLFVNFY